MSKKVERIIMKKAVLIVALVLLLLLISCRSNDLVYDQDNNMRLELIDLKNSYKAGEIIDCEARLIYIGDEQGFYFYSGDPLVMFTIKGGEYFDGINGLTAKDIAKKYSIKRNDVIKEHFHKSGTYIEDSPDKEFWKKYLSSDELILDTGEYEIIAMVVYYLEPGTEEKELIVSKKFSVK